MKITYTNVTKGFLIGALAGAAMMSSTALAQSRTGCAAGDRVLAQDGNANPQLLAEARECLTSQLLQLGGRYSGTLTAVSRENFGNVGCPAPRAGVPSRLSVDVRARLTNRWIGAIDGVNVEATINGVNAAGAAYVQDSGFPVGPELEVMSYPFPSRDGEPAYEVFKQESQAILNAALARNGGRLAGAELTAVQQEVFELSEIARQAGVGQRCGTFTRYVAQAPRIENGVRKAQQKVIEQFMCDFVQSSFGMTPPSNSAQFGRFIPCETVTYSGDVSQIAEQQALRKPANKKKKKNRRPNNSRPRM